MKDVHKKSLVKFNCTKKILADFVKWNMTMDKIQKSLEEYLESKRGVFPRFYFLSDDELLQILANSADVVAVERHINKCFDNIAGLTLFENG